MMSPAWNNYYVYLLTSDGQRPHPGNVVYVGKGKGYRWLQHYREALAGAKSDKHDRLMATLGSDPSEERIESHAFILAGELSEQVAFKFEAIAITLWPDASNAVSGHRHQDYLQRLCTCGDTSALKCRWYIGSAPRASALSRRRRSRDD
jgi:hypothetical protein